MSALGGLTEEYEWADGPKVRRLTSPWVAVPDSGGEQ